MGRPHPLREPAREFVAWAIEAGEALATSAEVLQELLHIYLPVDRVETLDAALDLVRRSAGAVWGLEPEDVLLGRSLAPRHPHLGARDLVHLACCRRRDVARVKTFDRGLAAAFGRGAL
ncbi:MAG TPA: PIN domain-containing protein [Thermoanaerobaculia bacterium]|nr:PIN domain-containing protein [Thermoanaerobaculia bacterium]